jgi:hypothetical protein
MNAKDIEFTPDVIEEIKDSIFSNTEFGIGEEDLPAEIENYKNDIFKEIRFLFPKIKELTAFSTEDIIKIKVDVENKNNNIWLFMFLIHKKEDNSLYVVLHFHGDLRVDIFPIKNKSFKLSDIDTKKIFEYRSDNLSIKSAARVKAYMDMLVAPRSSDSMTRSTSEIFKDII